LIGNESHIRAYNRTLPSIDINVRLVVPRRRRTTRRWTVDVAKKLRENYLKLCEGSQSRIRFRPAAQPPSTQPRFKFVTVWSALVTLSRDKPIDVCSFLVKKNI